MRKSSICIDSLKSIGLRHKLLCQGFPNYVRNPKYVWISWNMLNIPNYV